MLQGDLFKPLSFVESLSLIIDVYVSGFYPFTKIAAVLVGVKIILQVVLTPLSISVEDIISSDSTFLESYIRKLVILIVPYMVLNLLVSPIAEGSMIKVVADIYTGRQPDCAASLKLGVKKALPLLMTSLLVKWAVLSGFIFLIAPGLYVSVVWCAVSPAIILENFGITGSLKRSYNLVSGNRCYVFCTLMTVFVIRYELFSDKAAILSLFAIPLPAIIHTVMYFNLRVEKEGLTANDLLREMGERAESEPYHHIPHMDDERHRAWIRERRILSSSLGNAA
jgi:hypothetical protein